MVVRIPFIDMEYRSFRYCSRPPLPALAGVEVPQLPVEIVALPEPDPTVPPPDGEQVGGGGLW
jgi:hypothetical protein